MKEAAELLLGEIEALRDRSSLSEEAEHLLGVFEGMLLSDEFLEEEEYFMKHGEPKPRGGFSLIDLLTPPDVGMEPVQPEVV